MRYFTFALFYIFISSRAFSQESFPFSITGNLSGGASTGYIYLNYPIGGKWIKDSCLLANGSFSFAGKLVHPVLATMVYQNKVKEIFLEPVTMQLRNKEGNIEQAEIFGSGIQTEYEELDKKIKQINTRWQSVKDTLSAVNKRSNATFQELKSWILKPYFEEIRETYTDYIRQRPQSYVTAFLLSANVIGMNQGSLSVDTLKVYYDRFPDPVKKSMYGDKIRDELAKRTIAVPGTKSIEFTKKNWKGQQLSLSAFRGKVVLLDFWGSWCVPCRKENPHLKELYFRYSDKGFDIIGIAADNKTIKAWLKAIEQDALPWHQILIDDLETVYNITSYPTKILVDRRGMIIGRFGPDEKGLDEQLSSIFN